MHTSADVCERRESRANSPQRFDPNRMGESPDIHSFGSIPWSGFRSATGGGVRPNGGVPSNHSQKTLPTVFSPKRCFVSFPWPHFISSQGDRAVGFLRWSDPHSLGWAACGTDEALSSAARSCGGPVPFPGDDSVVVERERQKTGASVTTPVFVCLARLLHPERWIA